MLTIILAPIQEERKLKFPSGVPYDSGGITGLPSPHPHKRSKGLASLPLSQPADFLGSHEEIMGFRSNQGHPHIVTLLPHGQVVASSLSPVPFNYQWDAADRHLSYNSAY